MFNEIMLKGKVYKIIFLNNDYFINDNGDIIKIELLKNNKLKIIDMKPFITHDNHYKIQLVINGEERKFLIHRLVYKVWVGDLIEGLVIEHLDGNGLNNNVENLRQTTQKENIKTSIKQDKFHNNRKKILVYDKELNICKEYESIKSFYIDINAPKYMIEHGGLSVMNKRKCMRDRYIVTKINRNQQTIENVV